VNGGEWGFQVSEFQGFRFLIFVGGASRGEKFKDKVKTVRRETLPLFFLFIVDLDQGD